MKHHGFTLIELLVVIAIITILSAISLGGLAAVQQAAKRQATLLLISKVDAAVRSFRSDTGFFPKGSAATKPLEYETTGYNKGLIKTDPITGLPIPANDSVWAPAGTPSVWSVGNGLFARLGIDMQPADRDNTKANADKLAEVERDRFLHIGSFGDQAATGLSQPPGWHLTTYTYQTGGTQALFAYVDPVGPETLGEWELKRVFDHFRWPGKRLSRNSPWSSYNTYAETSSGTSRVYTKFSLFMVSLFNQYQGIVKSRDAGDAYRRAMRDGTAAGTVTYDSCYDTAGTALANGALTSRSVGIGTSDPWSGSYLPDLEPRYRRDVDGDGDGDIIDAYGRPLVYINEGMPHAKWIVTPQMKINGNPSLNSQYWGQSPDQNYGCMLLYHPDPDRESTNIINNNSKYCFVTDKPNSRGVDVRPDAYDIALHGSNNGSGWIFQYYGYQSGDPYGIAGTGVPSRARFNLENSARHTNDRYFLLSQDGSTLIEPFADSTPNGIWDSDEIYIDRNKNGSYDDDISPNDIRLCAPAGEEREFELISPGRDGLFHAVRTHRANVDNLSIKTRK